MRTGIIGWGRCVRTEYIYRDQLEHCYAALMPANRLVIQTMAATGLRISDVLTLRTEALKQRMTIKEHKTGKSRRVYVPAALLRQLESQAGRVWVFESPRDASRHRSRQAVWKDLKRAAKAFRLPQCIGTHSVRKAYAVELYHRYKDIDKVRRVLGHDRPETTMLYAMADQLMLHGKR